MARPSALGSTRDPGRVIPERWAAASARARKASVEVGRDLLGEWRDDRVTGLAAEIAFFGLISLFPTLIALTAALGSLDSIVGGDAAAAVERTILDFLRGILTDQASATVASVRELFESGSTGILTFGLLFALWSASRGFVAVINALDVAYDLEDRRGYLRLRLVGLGLALGSVVTGAVILTMLVIGPLLGTGMDVAETLGFGAGFATFWDWVRWPVALAVMIIWAATVLHLAPNHHTPWRWDLPGAALAAACWALFSVGFRIYLDVAGATNQVLGTLGGALIVLLWLYLLAVGLLLGGELNAVLAVRYGVKSEGAKVVGSRDRPGAT